MIRKTLVIFFATLLSSVASSSPIASIVLRGLQSSNPTNCYTATITGGSRTPSTSSSNTNYVLYPPSSEKPHSWDQDYRPNYDVQYGGTTYGYGCKCDGELTVALNWNGPDAPPQTVIIQEACYVSASTDGGSAEADNWLGDPTLGGSSSKFAGWTPPSNIIPPPMINHYSVMTGGSTVTFKRNPYARSFGGSSGNAWQSVTSVSYKIKAHPVTIQLGGTKKTDDSETATLIGRKITGNVPLPGFSLSNYNWSVTGSKFKKFELGANNVTGSVIPIDQSEWVKANPVWYWSAPDEDAIVDTVRCSATAKVNGVLIGTVSAQVPVKVVVPTSILSPVMADQWHFTDGASPDLWDRAQTNDPASFEEAAVFRAKISLPQPFFNDPPGTGCFVQTFSGQYSQTDSDGVLVVPPHYSKVLDGDFPYPFSKDIHNQTSKYFPTYKQPGLNGFADDSPAVLDLRMLRSFNLNDTFSMSLLFKPSGLDSEWVPLRACFWNAQASASRASTSADWPHDSVNIVFGSSITNIIDGTTSDHPTWLSKKVKQ